MNRIFSLVGFFLTVAIGFGQSTEVFDNETAIQIQKIPTESVYVHFNESLLFSGERLQYKFYCFDNSTKNLSRISKVGYVSLVAEDGNSIVDHKIVLEAGLGYGDFFIPTSVSTGSYKLIAYSNGMNNLGVKTFFHSNVKVVNPYQKLPKAHIEDYTDSLIPSINNAEDIAVELSMDENENDLLTMVIDKTRLGTREGVKLKIEALSEIPISGNYSLSVRKIDAISLPTKITSEVFFTDFVKRDKSLSDSNDFKGFIPELRGEMISGVLKNKKSGIPAKDQRVSLSLPGANFIHKIAVSNEKGEFHFYLDKRYDNTSGALQVLSNNWNDLEITLYDKNIDYDKLDFEEFVLSEKFKDEILERSIQNQLENAYQQVKSDSVIPLDYGNPFYRNLSTVYDLDDFTRFNSIQETIIEVIDQVSTRRSANGDRVFAIMPEVGVPNDILPMVFVDGLFIKRHQDIMDLSAKTIKSIGFSRKLFVLGAKTFQGILHLKTISGNFHEDFISPHLLKINLFKPQSPKNYYAEKYTEKMKKAHIADYRRQLLWQPNLTIEEVPTEIGFFTSDLTGKFEVVLEGFSSLGKPVSLKKTFSVH